MTPELAARYRGKTVLVTGDTGFKGSWLAIWLVELGARVIGYALPPVSARDNFVTAGVASRITHIDGDVRDHAHLAAVLAEHAPDLVFHLAAQAIVLDSYTDPRGTFETNVMGTVNLLAAVRTVPSVRAVVNVTSDKCYENREWVWGYRESDPLGGRDPYSASKAAAEIATSSMQRSFFGGADAAVIATARAGNVIGAGDWAPHRLVPDCIRALQAGEPIAIRHPRSTRPWQHVLDALHGYLHLAGVLAAPDGARFAGAWNFGPEPSAITAVEPLVARMVAAWGAGAYVVEPVAGAPAEAAVLHLDISKARQLLAWSPRLALADAIAMTIAGYRAESEAAEPGAVYAHRVRQIRAFGGLP